MYVCRVRMWQIDGQLRDQFTVSCKGYWCLEDCTKQGGLDLFFFLSFYTRELPYYAVRAVQQIYEHYKEKWIKNIQENSN